MAYSGRKQAHMWTHTPSSPHLIHHRSHTPSSPHLIHHRSHTPSSPHLIHHRHYISYTIVTTTISIALPPRARACRLMGARLMGTCAHTHAGSCVRAHTRMQAHVYMRTRACRLMRTCAHAHAGSWVRNRSALSCTPSCATCTAKPCSRRCTAWRGWRRLRGAWAARCCSPCSRPWALCAVRCPPHALLRDPGLSPFGGNLT